MAELQHKSRIMEFTIRQRAIDIVEQLLQNDPEIIGFGVYIWNITETCEVISMLKSLRADIKIIIGGPEVSYETELSPLYPWVDYIICGQADFSFAQICRQIKNGLNTSQKIINAESFHPNVLNLPYQFYNDDDIDHRVVYVEASRGCPFKCEFCLSSLDKTAQAFDIDLFLQEMDKLYQRGVRHFKFVDRTFNLNIKISERILQFFLDRLDDNLFLHFELIPDRLPEALKTLISQFPQGSLQFEIGIQSFNPEVQKIISRKQKHQQSCDNIRWLREFSSAHLHTDLIAGLPGEDLKSFAEGFDLLISLQPQEIQLGILKRLRGTPIIRHNEQFCMNYNPNAPYNILSTRDMGFDTLQRLNRFARYWDMFANSGRFRASLPFLLAEQPFDRFLQFSDWLYKNSRQTHKISLENLFRYLHQYLLQCKQGSGFVALLQKDFSQCGIKGRFEQKVQGIRLVSLDKSSTCAKRQQRHLS